ncbi:hypothetical protein B0J11DRAFT_427731 [Dendryphion nanum]|uniref:GATA-type domain-containing protein n=1 Tax=Dendryphion nanum TaxID=256645 RepID=A0A9P9IVF9_9PLEO|nr:hypothetical protein B0J11DRAFT_427731 [Dendryphion nanum]
MVSPLHSFPPPPPSHVYRDHQSSSASTLPPPLRGLPSPPESRRMSGDEKEQRPPARQSLPSIHEALGSEQPLSTYPPPPPSAPITAPPPFLPPSTTTSPSDLRGRTFSADHIHTQGPPNPFSHPRSPFMGVSTSTAPPLPAHTQSDSLHRPSLPPSHNNSKLPTLHPIRTNPSPPPGTSRAYPPFPPQQSSAINSPSVRSAGPMNPQYGYTQYQPGYPQSAPVLSGPNPGYPPPASAYSAPPRYPPPSWRENTDFGGPEDKKGARPSLAPYGESVKRHLESFDLEASLNEMTEGAGRITDFSKTYRQRAHENARIGMTLSSIPRLEEVDEMIKQSEKIQVSLQRMRDVVVNHHQSSFAESPREPYNHNGPMNGYDPDSRNSFHDDSKGGGGFAGAELKKRRPRAAPPGRCHSCNRAETPEWRRGPDGARTLCNACGLHYAKLTRKMGGKPVMSSSNLRPKSLGEGSPAV